ncbi:hypothetical protein KJ765_06025 [Candidatus Micrarchaeota archaeon]|nr:hypothetical protein [Candidatus Micrarchaeota archaeon]
MTDKNYVDHVPPVQMTSVLADTKQPFLNMSTRWNYISRYLEIWKEGIRFRGFAVVSFLAGLVLILSIPLMGILAFAAAAYFWELYKFRRHRLESQRSIMIGH